MAAHRRWIALTLLAGAAGAAAVGAQEPPLDRLFRRLDADGDGVVSAAEWEALFRQADRDGDARLSPEEVRLALRLRPDGGRPPEPEAGRPARRKLGERGVDAEVVKAAEALRRAQRGDAIPEEGEAAPDFRLAVLAGSSAPDFAKPDPEGHVRLSDHRGRPVVLIFGSYT